jgi:hypothetical protein
MESININANDIKRETVKGKKKKFRRSTIVYNFIDFIVKKVYLINDPIGIETE